MAVYEPSGYHISDLVQVNVIPTFNILQFDQQINVTNYAEYHYITLIKKA